MKPKFDYYEVVRLCDAKSVPSELIGREVVILGMTRCDDGKWNYAVDIPEVEACRCFDEECFESTGKFKRREDFYSGDSVKVLVDPHKSDGKNIGNVES